ncbi:hypothetical protein QN277_025298 [Acacia crassicarpa]|uniref:RING-CH-type domain-containing protein n=1 Tax=Acacia crassicarpa TaxID=499986 RepID=A0AAE1JHB2_9FABA|nr:hypothetical protein QN277_025298 [Acacia crassicarpa]
MLPIIRIRHADLEQGRHGCDMIGEARISLSKARDRECRICHMGLESDRHVSGVPIELGCSCKHDLAAAHKLCAEKWFRSQGNRTCEICHSVARNVFATNEETTENLRDRNNVIIVSTTQPESPRSFCLDRSFLKFCMFIIFISAFIAFMFFRY